ncbi:MAG: NUDIX hydrolase [Nocardioidaceae bacterium]
MARPDAMTRRAHPAHLTAGVLVLSGDRREVLLTLHRKARRWFHLGGHCEPGDETLAQAALREGSEESGIEGLRLSPGPLHLDAHRVAFCGGHPEVTHLDVRYLALAPTGARPVVSEESLAVRWWPVDGLPDGADDLAALVAAGLARAAAER